MKILTVAFMLLFNYLDTLPKLNYWVILKKAPLQLCEYSYNWNLFDELIFLHSPQRHKSLTGENNECYSYVYR